MKFIKRQVEAPLEILFNDHFVGRPIMLKKDTVTPNSDGRRIIKAGTIYPSNDANAEGVILHNTEVAHADSPGTIVIHGFIDNKKLVQNGVTVSAAAKEALKLIDFVEIGGA